MVWCGAVIHLTNPSPAWLSIRTAPGPAWLAAYLQARPDVRPELLLQGSPPGLPAVALARGHAPLPLLLLGACGCHERWRVQGLQHTLEGAQRAGPGLT